MSVGQKNALCPPCGSKQALKYYEKAREARNDRKPFSEVRELCEKAIAEDSSCSEVLKLLGDAAYQARNDKVMGEAYARLLAVCPDASAEAHYRLASWYYANKDYQNAIAFFESFTSFGKVKEENARDAMQKITRARLMMKPVPFHPVPLEGVCTADPEYLAIISPDQEFCFFTRRYEEQKKGALFPTSVEKFMISEKKEGSFDKGEPLPAPFNKSGSNNEGGASITIDDKHLYFTVNKNGNFDIYTSDEVAGQWTEPRSLGREINDPEFWDSQPCIAPDGKTLYFVSIRDSVTRTSDIYVSRRENNGNWKKASPLPSPINTPGSEKTPFIHPDNKTFYFSSDNLSGMGGYDIFMSKLQADGSWSTPVNLGYPINTEGNELGFFVSTDGKKGYFASDQLKGKGSYDIFEFDLHEAVKPDRVLFIKGDLKDETETAPGAAKIELRNAASQELAEVVYDTISGKYASVVAFNDDYILTVKKKDYAFNSAYFSKADTSHPEPKKVDFTLERTRVGGSYTLHNVLFESKSATLTLQDKTIISGFADYLKENPTIRVELQGHTDDMGDAASNQKLSEERARSVYNYLLSTGISAARLSSRGFGQTRPVADNTTTEGRSKNRRTEFVITAR